MIFCKQLGGQSGWTKVALDAASGKEIWRTETIREPARQSGLNEGGTPRWGPSGAGAWNTPTLDIKLKSLYIGTGDNHSTPTSDTADAIRMCMYI